ncbi:MAG TPA: GNAT family protein [Bacteroidia bacterium]|jgi:RimJ/RimL family protein N-acetyltransferase|nr:GNAT family protein [Bacteroidia bacterium]
MSNWIPDNTIIRGGTVELLPLEKEHYPAIIELAQDKRIWEFQTYDGTRPTRLTELLNSLLTDRDKGVQYPFVIVHKKEKKIIGCTRFIDIQKTNKKLEIGGTWLHPDYWATEVNPDCKYNLLKYCFEELGTYRVQLKTDENNIRSRKAIEKIGGKLEGILRNDMVRDNGTKRNSAYYSILDSEWTLVKKSLGDLYLKMSS